jgi:hypothetical protein
MTPEELRHHDAAEAASLQTYLMEYHPDVRPEYPNGLFAWAEAALRKEDPTLIQHMEAAAHKMKRRDKYVYMIIMSALNTLRKPK